MTREREGVQAAIAAVGGTGAPAGSGEQLDLVQAIAAVPVASEPRGPGRPAGSRGKRTKDWQRWFTASGALPLEFLAKVYREDTGELAKRLEIKTGEALRMQISAAEACLPYVEQKMPIAIEDSRESARPVIVIGTLSAAQQGAVQGRFGNGLRLRGGDGKPQQNQGIVDVIAETSDAQNSEADTKPP